MKRVVPDSKVIMLGKENVGKTALLYRFIHDTFTASYSVTLGVACSVKEIKVEGRSITLAIWDTAGQERFYSLTNSFYRDAVAAILCYDMSDRSSYDRACFWSVELRQKNKDCKVFLCGTKKDLVDKNAKTTDVTSETIQPLMNELQASAFETSSKSGESIDQLFKAVAAYCIQKKDDELKQKQDGRNIVQVHEPMENKGCPC